MHISLDRFTSTTAGTRRCPARYRAQVCPAPWDNAEILPPSSDPAFRETVFDFGYGTLSFDVNETTGPAAWWTRGFRVPTVAAWWNDG
jgi:hypothetical protein